MADHIIGVCGSSANFPQKKFKEIRYTMTDNNDRDGRTDSDELLAINDIGDYWSTSPPKKHIHVIVKLPLLSLEEALSCIPPPITYSPDCTKSKTTTKVNGDHKCTTMGRLFR
ncbi:unnamed protein product [Rhizophagus irregularis]|nr:unnamed protein product [Rhizophagus irregularis]